MKKTVLVSMLVGATALSSGCGNPQPSSSTGSSATSASAAPVKASASAKPMPEAPPTHSAAAIPPPQKVDEDVAALCTKIDSLSKAQDTVCGTWLGSAKVKEAALFTCLSKCVDGAKTLDDAAKCMGACPKSTVAARFTVLVEATRSLAAIETASKDKFKRGTVHAFCGASSSDAKDSGGSPQPAAVPRATTAKGDWSGGVWKCLKFSFSAPSLCQYAYVSSGQGPAATFTATATCDHDGDGKGTFITLKEKVDAKGEIVRESLLVTGDDDD